MEPDLSATVERKQEPERREERCTAPHPARAFLLSLPAFAILIAVVLLLWMLLV